MYVEKVIFSLLLILVNTRLSVSSSDSILQLLLQNISPTEFYSGNERSYKWLAKANTQHSNLNRRAKTRKLQVHYADSTPFPCDVTQGRSPERPTSVHALRPGDIDVIGAMGDSLTAGYGETAIDLINLSVANRGSAWSGGGKSNWREFMTLPNILKEFNPALVGYSLGDALTWERDAQFNVAEGGAISRDMPHQAKILVKRMKSDKRVNMKEDWKLVTLFIGANDHCTYICYEKEDGYLSAHRKDLMETLDILHEVPRMLVNLLPSINLEILSLFTDRPLHCLGTQSFFCPCIIGALYKRKQRRYIELMNAWQRMDSEIGNSGRYRDRDDFAIVVQPFTINSTFPQRSLPNGRTVTDYSYSSVDCFHFSQKCSAIAANALWNNMVEPVGNKSLSWSWNLMERFLCPTPDRPYIYTYANS